MRFDSVTEGEILEWHRAQGGSGKRMAGHATRLLRECLELCVASGATPLEIHEAFFSEMSKAADRGDFLRAHSLSEVTEEFVDVSLLSVIFRSHFIKYYALESEMRRKLDVCKERKWEPDADGVLWRPGTRPASRAPLEPKSS